MLAFYQRSDRQTEFVLYRYRLRIMAIQSTNAVDFTLYKIIVLVLLDYYLPLTTSIGCSDNQFNWLF